MEIFLYIILIGSGLSSTEINRVKMPDMETCVKVLKESKLEKPIDSGAMFCGGPNERHYSSTWWTDKREIVK